MPEVLPVEAAPAPWERQPNESAKGYWYFQQYRGCHPLERSLARVGRESGVSTSFIERLSSQHGWVARSEAWDLECDRQARARLSDRLDQMQRQYLAVAETTLTKISERLTNLDSSDIQVQHVPKLLEAVVRIQESLSPAPTQTLQPRQLLGATELRRELKELGMLSASPQPADVLRPDLQRWLNGDLDSI